jgi:hypothetical protein
MHSLINTHLASATAEGIAANAGRNLAHRNSLMIRRALRRPRTANRPAETPPAAAPGSAIAPSRLT